MFCRLKPLQMRPTAQLRAAIEKAGTPVGGNDLLVAAQAMALDMVLVTDNEIAVRPLCGLKVEDWFGEQ